MAISITEILGTDSLSGSRLVINDNFNILADEINAIEGYFDPSSGIIDSLNSLQTDALVVGLGTIVLEVNSSTFDIISNVTITGDLNLEGSLLRNDIESASITEVSTAPSLLQDIGNITSVPGSTVYRVHNAGTSPLTLSLYTGAAGQEVIFVYEGGGSGDVDIVAGSGATLTLTGAGATVTMNDAGQSVQFLSITNSIGNQEWFVIGGNGYIIS